MAKFQGKIVINSCWPLNVQEKNCIICMRYGWTNLSLVSLFGITRQSLVMPNSDPWDRFVHPYLTLMSDSYIIPPLTPILPYKSVL